MTSDSVLCARGESHLGEAGRETGGGVESLAAELLGLSSRHMRRVKARYGEDGPASLVHGNRGRSPVHRLSDTVRRQVLELARGKYQGLNHQHLTEKLVEDEHLSVSRMSVHRILRAAGLVSPRSHRPAKHRQRRERMPQEGMLLQADGSRHRWFGPDGPYLTLIGGIDDATGIVPWAVFREQEDAHGYLAGCRRWSAAMAFRWPCTSTAMASSGVAHVTPRRSRSNSWADTCRRSSAAPWRSWRSA